jgi:voltage-gated potassium channel
VFGAAGAFLAERNAEDSNIASFEDALWWAVTTMTTVGDGDRVPTTPEGRAVGVVLTFFGIASLGALTAVFAAALVREDEARGDTSRDDVVLEELRAIRAELRERDTSSWRM